MNPARFFFYPPRSNRIYFSDEKKGEMEVEGNDLVVIFIFFVSFFFCFFCFLVSNACAFCVYFFFHCN